MRLAGRPGVNFYEPFVVLAVVVALYIFTVVAPRPLKRRALWYAVAVIIAFGSGGAACSLARSGRLGLPAFSD